MRVSDMSLIGWFHALFCLVAMFTGGRNLFAAKGTPSHRYAGQWYVASMVLLNVSALFVYKPARTAFSQIDLNRFGVFHWLALATLAIVAVGYVTSSRQVRAPFAYLHPICMVASYYMLIAGSVNEFYARVILLSGLARRTHGAAIGFTHAFVMLVSFGVVTYFVGRVAAYRKSERATQTNSLSVAAE